MKKVVSVALLVVLLFALATTVKAETYADKLYNYVSGSFNVNGQSVKLFTDQELKQAKDFLSTKELDEASYDNVVNQINATVTVMNKAGVSSVFDLKGEDLENVKANVQSAAQSLGVTVEYSSTDKVFLVKDEKTGEVVGSRSLNGDKPVQTDIVNYGYVAIPVVAIIAVAMVAVYKKVEADA